MGGDSPVAEEGGDEGDRGKRRERGARGDKGDMGDKGDREDREDRGDRGDWGDRKGRRESTVDPCSSEAELLDLLLTCDDEEKQSRIIDRLKEMRIQGSVNTNSRVYEERVYEENTNASTRDSYSPTHHPSTGPTEPVGQTQAAPYNLHSQHSSLPPNPTPRPPPTTHPHVPHPHTASSENKSTSSHVTDTSSAHSITELLRQGQASGK